MIVVIKFARAKFLDRSPDLGLQSLRKAVMHY
jgi:hypothetical protein